MINSLLRLSRPRVGLMAVAAALVGWLLRRPGAGLEAWPELLACLGGVFLLAAGCSALNQVQERRRDALMGRTASRPLPSGRMTTSQVMGVALVCLSGAGSLFALAGQELLILAGLVLVLYNGLYTPLKAVTPFCLLLGGAAGALPPVFGWVAAGGDPLDGRILVLAGVVYLWQTPHFWLFALKHGAEYRAAGFPVLGSSGRVRPHPAFTVWLACYGLAILMAPVFCLGRVDLAGFLPALAAALLALCGGARLGRSSLGFGLVNASLLVFLAGLAADVILRPYA